VVWGWVARREAIPPIYDLSNITHSAISDGELIIRDQDKQTQDINELSHGDLVLPLSSAP